MKAGCKEFMSVFYLLIWMIITQTLSYSQSDVKFPFGVYAQEHWYENYQQIKDMGANTIVQYAADGSDTTYNLNYLTDFDKVIALNFRRNDYIHYYSEGYYKKWQAEENIGDLKSGIKHRFGESKTVGGDSCWSTGNQTTPQNEFIYGPHYAQDKKYRQGYMSDNYILNYNVKYRLRLETQPTQPVNICRLRIKFNYKLEGDPNIYSQDLGSSRDVSSSELSTSQFRDIMMTYSYPQEFIPSAGTELKFTNGPTRNTLNYDDRLEGTGIEFIVDYLGGAKLCVDFIEVYDQQIWGQYLSNPPSYATLIKNYATRSSYLGMQNLKYWHSQDAPLSLDGYEPYRVIDSLLNSTLTAKPIITDYYPMWNGLNKWQKQF